MAAYLVTLVLYVVWLWIGVGWRLDGEVHDDGKSGGGSGGHYAYNNGHGHAGGGCPNHVGNWVDADVFWGFVFLTALLWMLILSFALACCCDSGRDYSYVEIDNNIGDEEQMMINGGVNQQSINTGSRKQKKQYMYGTVPSATAAVAIPTPSAPPYDPKIPVATATPIGLDKR